MKDNISLDGATLKSKGVGVIATKKLMLQETIKFIIAGVMTLAVISTITFYVIPKYICVFDVIKGKSMEKTLQEDDYVLVEKISNKVNGIKRGSVIAFHNKNTGEHSGIVKRVIAIEGDTIECKDNKVYLNGKELIEDYVHGTTTDFKKTKIEAGEVYVLGDNRNKSIDSRRFGNVKISNVDGICRLRVYPIEMMGVIK